MFGGAGIDSTGTSGFLSDLWKYSGGQWTWIGGANVINQSGTYGTQGIAAQSNAPGAREFPVIWTDSIGNFWLFGGLGYDSTGRLGFLNDLWEFRTSTGQWVWMSGSTIANQGGTYGTEGTTAPNNIPGSRQAFAHWTDGGGNLWLFGGNGYDSTGMSANLNDIWRYEP